MKLRYALILSGFTVNSIVFATQIEKSKEQEWNDSDNMWEDVDNPDVCTNKASVGGPVYETVTITTTWVPPDLNIWAYPGGFLAATTTVYDTEEEAEMALERSQGKKKKFRRRKKHFKKKMRYGSHHYNMKPQAYLDEQQNTSSIVSFIGEYQNNPSIQEGDVILEEWQDQYGNVIAASSVDNGYYKNAAGDVDVNEKSQLFTTTTSILEMSTPSLASLQIVETLLPKVLLNDEKDAVVSSDSNVSKSTIMSWTMVLIAIICYLV